MATSVAEATDPATEMTPTSSLPASPERSDGEIPIDGPPTTLETSNAVDNGVEAFEDEPESDAERDIPARKKRQNKSDKTQEKPDSKGLTAGNVQASPNGKETSRSPLRSESGNISPSPGLLHRRKSAGATAERVNSEPRNKSTRSRPRLDILLPKPPSSSKLQEDTKLRQELDEDDSVDVYGKGRGVSSGLNALVPPTLAPDEASVMTDEDLEICRQLDEEYERALEEREVGYNARYKSVTRSAAFSIAFMLVYMTLGTIFFTRVAGWEFHQALFFSVYTITTVGYGSQEIPKSTSFQIYSIFYIFVGIATLTIMVAQVYQCIQLTASRAQHSRDKAELARKSREMRGVSVHDNMEEFHNEHSHTMLDTFLHHFYIFKRFLRDTQLGRGVSVVFPFAGLILIGATVVGLIEGWDAVESVYFAVVSLTTLGYGDYVPTKVASVWFTIFWLPFSVGFMSLFLGSVAAFYIRLSDRDIQRLERQMRYRMKQAKDRIERERAEALRRATRGQDALDDAADSTDEEQMPDRSSKVASLRNSLRQFGFEFLPDDEDGDEQALFGSPEAAQSSGQLRRECILQNSIYAGNDGPQRDRTVTTMRDILTSVRRSMVKDGMGEDEDEKEKEGSSAYHFMSMKSTTLLSTSSHSLQPQVKKKPSFAMRALVQERMAEIIAVDIAGSQSNIEINENTLSVTIDSFEDMADKWLVPRRARKAFRSVAFEALYFVGEHGLITRGADALFDLTPFEFHRLFSPLLAAMGDADTMEGWLATTNILAEVDLKRDSPHGRARTDRGSSKPRATDGRSSSFRTPEKLEPAKFNMPGRLKPAPTTVDDGELM